MMKYRLNRWIYENATATKPFWGGQIEEFDSVEDAKKAASALWDENKEGIECGECEISIAPDKTGKRIIYVLKGKDEFKEIEKS
jgi:hypothetical protein